jgi:hypothetical protein
MSREKISIELARIHAHLCGDGFVCIWKTKEKDRRFRAVSGYCNKNQKLLDKFREDFNKVFNVKMKMEENKQVSIKSIRIFNQLSDQFGEFGSKKWKIPNLIKKSNENIKVEWLKSFFEDEAYNEKKYDRLKIKSMNFLGLRDVKEILDSLKIKSSLTGPNIDKSYYLTIPRFSSIKEFKGFIKEPIRK